MRNAASVAALVATLTSGLAPADATSLRFFGHGSGGIDRVEIPIDAPAVPADVGGDFTIELWAKALPGENAATGCVAKDVAAAPGQTGWFKARNAPAPVACPLP